MYNVLVLMIWKITAGNCVCVCLSYSYVFFSVPVSVGNWYLVHPCRITEI